MISVVLYKFNKKRNSTKLPNTDGTSINCLLRSPTSVINPILVLEANTSIEQDINYYNYNYVYIDRFKRYYFITNIIYDNNTWILELQIDVLASFKNDILNSTQMVIRTSTPQYINQNLVDPTYKTTTGQLVYNRMDTSTKMVQELMPTFDDSPISYGNYFGMYGDDLSGNYIVGVVNGTGKGLSYYSFLPNAFIDFMNKVLSLSPTMTTGSGSLSTNVARAIYDGIQYIKYCRWFPNAYFDPYTAPTENVVSTIQIGSQNITLSSSNKAVIFNEYNIGIATLILDIPKSPYASTYRKYLNLKPYAELNLFMLPFGSIPLDTTKLYNADSLLIRWTVDYCTGTTQLELAPYKPSSSEDFNPRIDNHDVFYTKTGSIGVDVPLYNLVVDAETTLGLMGVSWISNTLADTLGNSSSKINQGIKNLKERGESLNKKYFPWYQNFLDEHIKPLTERGRNLANNVDSAIDVVVPYTVDDAIDIFASSLGQIQCVGNPSSYLSYRSNLLPTIYGYFYNQTEIDLQKNGAPCYQSLKLSLLDGFTICENAYIDFIENLTNTNTNPNVIEREAVINYLNSGVYIE